MKTLGRLLPICACCRKMRDDGGYWQRVETFFGEHATDRFAHGIGPECEKKMMA